MKFYKSFVFLLAASLLAGSLSMAEPQDRMPPPPPMPHLLHLGLMVDAQNQFGANLFQESLKKDSRKNTLVSPISAHQALQMLMQGAAQDTLAALIATLKLQSVLFRQTSDLNRMFLNELRENRKEFALSIANSLWVDKRLPVSENYIQNLQEFFAEANNAYRLADPGVGGIINKWVDDKTNGKIQELLPENLEEGTSVVLVNATYFKADWERPFLNHGQELKMPFRGLDRKDKTVSGMSQTSQFRYYADKAVEVLSLPYKNGDASMLIVLPGKKASFSKIGKGLTSERISQIQGSIAQADYRRVMVVMPKFKFEYMLNLVDPLKAMGLETIFTEAANFSRISEVGMSVSDALQKTFIAVDEKGTEAAAATAIIGRTITSVEPWPTSFVVDRPFYFLIQDKTGAILFMGSVVDPSK